MGPSVLWYSSGTCGQISAHTSSNENITERRKYPSKKLVSFVKPKGGSVTNNP